MANSKPELLIVDDDPLITDTLQFALGRDFAVTVRAARAPAVEYLRQQPRAPRLALVDLGLPPTPQLPNEGFKLIGDLLAHAPDIRILVLSGQNEESNARRARALGAVDFVPKPCEPERLRGLLLDALKIDVAGMRAASAAKNADAHAIVGESAPLQKLRQQIALYAGSAFPVLVEGESGSGKERVAAALHHLSPRAQQPYFALNCAAISPTLVEPTLFGYAKGAFTGAVGAKSGYFEDAGGGTLFLDEIGELPLDLQAKLLRVLENGEYQRVGETQTRVSRARIVAATNRDLRREIKAGRFRADLYHRLSVLTVAVPPLRELGQDKLVLLDHFRAACAQQVGTQPFELDASGVSAWLAYSFPGNVRELRNIVIRLTTKHAGHKLGRREIEAEFDLEATIDGVPSSAAEPKTALEEATSRLLRGGDFNLDDVLRDTEEAYVEAALQLSHGNVSQAAKMLGVNRTTLYSRMEIIAKRAAEGRASDEGRAK